MLQEKIKPLQPGTAEIISIHPPQMSGKWSANFVFRIKTSSFEEFVRYIYEKFNPLNSGQTPDQVFVFVGPEIEN